MSKGNLKKGVLLLVGIITAGGIYFLLREGKKAQLSTEPSQSTTTAPPTTFQERNAPTKSPSAPFDAARKNDAPSRAPSTGVDTKQEIEAEAPRCSSDADCRGPRTADCIKTSCKAGSCQNDERACGCSSHADCRDEDACTRDHCFARTRKCVFIPIDGCK